MKTYEEMAKDVLKRIKLYGEQKKARHHLILICTTISAFSIFMLALLGFVAPASARELPLFGNVFSYIQDHLDFWGVYSNYAFYVGDTSSDNNVDITLSEVYCDGNNLFISFIIKSTRFNDWFSSNTLNLSQLDYTASYCITSEDESYKLTERGITGIEGKFIDENTFVGAEVFILQEKTFPDTFKLQVDISSINSPCDSNASINGYWKFDVNVDCNRDDVIIYDLDVCNDNHSIDKIIVSPVMVSIYTAYPNLYSGTVHYRVAVFSDLYPDEEIEKAGKYTDTTGVTLVPRNKIGNELYIYIYDASKFEEGEVINDKNTIMNHSIVSTEIKLQ